MYMQMAKEHLLYFVSLKDHFTNSLTVTNKNHESADDENHCARNLGKTL